MTIKEHLTVAGVRFFDPAVDASAYQNVLREFWKSRGHSEDDLPLTGVTITVELPDDLTPSDSALRAMQEYPEAFRR